MITLGCVAAVIYQEVMGSGATSNTLQQIVTLIIGFYFGAEANSAVSDNRNQNSQGGNGSQ